MEYEIIKIDDFTLSIISTYSLKNFVKTINLIQRHQTFFTNKYSIII